MENLQKDEQDKASESKACCINRKSFSPSSARRAGKRQPLLGVLRRSQCPASGPSRGNGRTLRAEEVPRLWEGPHISPWSREPCGPGSRGAPERSCFAPPGANETISGPPDSSDDHSPGANRTISSPSDSSDDHSPGANGTISGPPDASDDRSPGGGRGD